MSRYTEKGGVTVLQILKSKAEKKKISAITCYDSSFARLIDETDIDIVLVGDSLGNVMLGYDSTISVTMDHMVHHVAAVSRVLKKPFLCADMPFLSYHLSPEQALQNAGRLVQEGGAQSVKLEGGEDVAEAIRRITAAGIPVMAHLGLTPQSVHAMGGYRIQGRGTDAADKLIEEARIVEAAGAYAIVLEMVPASVAKKVTEAVGIPTIGIGAGPDCDGQILVLQDMLGFDDGFNPKFLKKYANLAKTIQDSVSAYDKEVKSGTFPTADQSFKD